MLINIHERRYVYELRILRLFDMCCLCIFIVVTKMAPRYWTRNVVWNLLWLHMFVYQYKLSSGHQSPRRRRRSEMFVRRETGYDTSSDLAMDNVANGESLQEIEDEIRTIERQIQLLSSSRDLAARRNLTRNSSRSSYRVVPKIRPGPARLPKSRPCRAA